MRFSPLAVLAGLTAFAHAEESVNPVTDPTTFNGVSVPPLLELSPTTWEEELKKNKYLMVKHFSPYCKHCTHFAPTYQTLYDFYYTSKPHVAGVDKSFSEYYDFKFAVINCVAYYDLCMDHNVMSYPTTILYGDGKEVHNMRGIKNMTVLSNAIEKALAVSHPGRPEILELPEPGDTAAENAAEEPAGKAPGTSLDDITETPKEAAKDETPESPKESAAAKEGEKSSFGDDWKVPTTGEMLKKTKPKDSSPKYNLDGASTPLTPDTFPKLVTNTKDPWFIKFLRPLVLSLQGDGPYLGTAGQEDAGKA
ncbi:hypothetical protein CEP52_011398 [Fusarium oligoseptatum]|uniref:Thioredoxin domain-containing protein n=1 Tax=Fusarium oligoseptatum TaxID=2604345 RepID=A0A428T3B1_9HYPO|nr:hypothetical protein CEP52_011398 [Fusarium oligoseptatum]